MSNFENDYKNQFDSFIEIIAVQIAKHNLIESLLNLKVYIKSKLSQKKVVFTYGDQQQMGFHIFPFIIDKFLRYCTKNSSTFSTTNELIDWMIPKHQNFSPMVESDPSRKNTYEEIIKISFEQFGNQERSNTLIPRSLFLYDDIPNSNIQKHSAFINSLQLVCEKQFRLDIKELIFATCLVAAAGDSKIFLKDKIPIDENWNFRGRKSNSTELVLQQFSLTPEEYMIESRKREDSTNIYFKTFPFVILDFPIISIKDIYILPYSHLLIDVVTDRLDHTICKFFENNENDNTYIDGFGQVFGEYIGILLKHLCGKRNTFDLDELVDSSSGRADWVIKTKYKVFIFECKCLRYKFDFKTTGNLDELEQFMNNRLEKPIEQLNKTEVLIKENRISPTFINSKVFHKVIIVLENFHFMNLLGDCLPNNKLIQEMNNYNIHFLSVLDLEVLLTSNFRNQFVPMYEEWTKHIVEFPTLRQFIYSRKNYKKNNNNILDRKFDKFFSRNKTRRDKV